MAKRTDLIDELVCSQIDAKFNEIREEQIRA